MSTYDQVLAGMKKASDNVQEVKGTFPPTLKLHSKGGTTKGAFVSGVLRDRKLVKINLSEQPVYSLTLGETNAKVLKKEDKVWVDAVAKAGDLVSFFAPTRLDRVLRDLGSNTQVLIHYDGMSPQKTPHGMKDTHMFTVHIGDSDNSGAPVEAAAPSAASEADPFA